MEITKNTFVNMWAEIFIFFNIKKQDEQYLSFIRICYKLMMMTPAPLKTSVCFSKSNS